MSRQNENSDKEISSEPRNVTSPASRPSLGSSSIFSQNRKAPLKIKVNKDLLNKINSSKKFGSS